MNIKKSLSIPAPDDETAIFMTRTTYVAPDGEALLQEYAELTASDTFGEFYSRRSSDNGRTWARPELTSAPVQVPEGMMRRGEFAFLLDSKRNRLIRFYNMAIYPDLKTHTVDVARTLHLRFEISEDEGKTFSAAQQLIVKGCNQTEWAPDVCYGKNSSAISFCQPFMDAKDCMILPAQWQPVLPEGHVGPFPLDTLCFIGATEKDGGITWTVSERVTIDESLSVRGLVEPTVTELGDGRFFMVCRGSNVWHPEMPARKWITTSDDGGAHWEQVKPFAYHTGELFYSPATGSRLIRSSRNQKLYWIGNILPENPEGNNPRYPLCIAEVDENRLALRKETIFQIDNRGPDDTPRVQLSNFHVYEDRTSGEFVLMMPRIFERSETSLVSPSYEYRIVLLSS